MKIRISICFAAVFLLTSLTGCSEKSRVDSNNVTTSNIYAAIDVSSDNDESIFVSAQFKEGGSSSTTYIDMSGSDRLIVSMKEKFSEINVNDDLFSSFEQLSQEHKVMEQVGAFWSDWLGLDIIDFPETWYKTEFSNVDVEQRVYVSLFRDNHANAEDSSVVLPPSYVITSPIAEGGALYSRSMDNIVVNWSPSGTAFPLVLDVIATCEDNTTGSWQLSMPTDIGTATIPSGILSLTDLDGKCTYQIRLKKTALGSFDPHYGSGIIRGAQVRSVSVATSD